MKMKKSMLETKKRKDSYIKRLRKWRIKLTADDCLEGSSLFLFLISLTAQKHDQINVRNEKEKRMEDDDCRECREEATHQEFLCFSFSFPFFFLFVSFI
jgi:hypothetical protein